MLIYDKYPESDKLTPPLLETIRTHKKQHPDMTLGVAGGRAWSGYKTQWGWPPELGRFYSWLRRTYPQVFTPPYYFSAWGNIISEGGSLNSHNHADGSGNNKWSGVYYLTEAVLNIMDRELEFYPGEFILFPANQFHSVNPVTQERISLAFNISTHE